jgi:hypothetical protein
MGKSSLSKPPMVLATPFSPCRAMVLQGHGAALKYNLGGKCWIYPRKSLPKGWFSDVWSNSPILCLRSMHLYNSRYTWMLVTMHPRSSSWSLFHGCELRTNRYWANGNSDCKWWFCLANEPEIRSGWWYTYPSEKYEFVSWDDEIPNIWKNKSKPPTIKYLSFKNSMIGYQSCIRFSFDDPSELGGKHFFVGLPVTSLVSRLLSCCRSKSLIAIYLPMYLST